MSREESLPEAVVPLCRDFIASTAEVLPELVDAFYIVGSIALGAFDPGYSDVDFIAVVSRQCTGDDIERLTTLHNVLVVSYADTYGFPPSSILPHASRGEEAQSPPPRMGEG